LSNIILFGGSSYGGGISVTPVKRLSVSGTFNRAISNTIASTTSHNNMEIFNAQMQYHLRKIGLLAGYTRFTQGISAIGAPANTTSYFVGMTRWFDFF
jgi:carboxylesterase type B